MKLLIDIGNTRLKWAFARDGKFVANGAIVHDGEPARIIAALPAERVDAVWISQVAGAEHEAALGDAARIHYEQEARFARTTAEWNGLRNRYREPQRLGVDRWLAMIAAWHAQRGAVCVVDAGTALTADAIAADGSHLGGFIAAGLEAQQRAVLGTTRFATRSFDVAYTNGFGNDTESCVRQGAMLACVGAIDRARALTASGAACLTGGDAATLLPHLGGSCSHHPLLVLEGLHVLADTRARE